MTKLLILLSVFAFSMTSFGDEPTCPKGLAKKVTSLKKKDLKKGKGDKAKAGDTLSMQYTGWTTDCQKFDSSYDHGGQPFEFELGAGHVIKGWDEGVKGMQPGGVRQLIIPAKMGYGDRGAGDKIPPGATLVFVVELISKK